MYSFANGYFKAKSTEILNIDDYNALKKLDEERFFGYLNDQGFGLHEDINKLYETNLKKLKDDLNQTLENDPLIKVFFYDIDALNLKLLYKTHYFNGETKDHVSKLGNIKPQHLINALKHADYSGLNDNEKVVFETLAKYPNLTPKESSDFIDQLFLDLKFKVSYRNKELTDYLKVYVTLKNILTIIRAKQIHLSTDLMNNSILNGGMFDKNKALELYNGSFDVFLHYVSTLYIGKLDFALNKYKQNEDLEEFELSLDKAFYEIL
ncbi:MAG: V-type ATPase subunit, partial [Acholeplasmataceae bacterium]|nr:V-type ATPase subunit [Acholeplasmataceae bacterium]